MMPSHQAELLPRILDASSSVEFRLARPADAAYLYGLRINERLNTYLSAAPPSIEAQEDFLRGYVVRESEGKEYYFVIRNKRTGDDCGAVRIYDVQPESFCWGSWILDERKPRLAALDSALFVYDFGFGLLDFPSSHFDVRRENGRVISFHERMGAQRVREDELNVYFVLGRAQLAEKLPRLLSHSDYRPLFLRELDSSSESAE